MTYREEIREHRRQMDHELVVPGRASFARLAAEEERQIAGYIVARALKVTTRKIHLSVLCRGRELPTFPYHWKYKNAVGVSFDRKDVAAAQAWAFMALVAGYCIIVQWRKHSTGFIPGYSRDGEYRIENCRE